MSTYLIQFFQTVCAYSRIKENKKEDEENRIEETKKKKKKKRNNAIMRYKVLKELQLVVLKPVAVTFLCKIKDILA